MKGAWLEMIDCSNLITFKQAASTRKGALSCLYFEKIVGSWNLGSPDGSLQGKFCKINKSP